MHGMHETREPHASRHAASAAGEAWHAGGRPVVVMPPAPPVRRRVRWPVRAALLALAAALTWWLVPAPAPDVPGAGMAPPWEIELGTNVWMISLGRSPLLGFSARGRVIEAFHRPTSTGVRSW